MGIPENLCLSLLKPMRGRGYSAKAVRELWHGVKVSPELPFDRAAFNAFRGSHSGRMSISGVQEKISLRLDGKTLTPVTTGGEYLLKPVPKAMADLLDLPGDVPANEHVTMQIASQVFGIRTALSGLIFFLDGAPALLVRRFDREARSGRKLRQEDFCQLTGRSRQTGGMEGGSQTALSFDRVQLCLRQWGRPPEELFPARKHAGGSSAQPRLRPPLHIRSPAE